MTDQYAVIGHPIAHSKSPLIHSRFAAQTGQDMRYVALLAPLDGFVATVREFIAAGGRGMNVTVPFKEEAFRLATQLSPRARAAGAVNTLSFNGPEILADNTDGCGLVRDITINLRQPIRGRNVLLLGAGGAARGGLLPLRDEAPARLVVANRTASKAQALAAELKPHGLTLETCSLNDLAGQSFDIVINATSAGLTDSTLELPDNLFAPGGLAYEMLYGRRTPFMAQAERSGVRVADGLGMLVEQAAAAFKLWRGVSPETSALLHELRGA